MLISSGTAEFVTRHIPSNQATGGDGGRGGHGGPGGSGG